MRSRTGSVAAFALAFSILTAARADLVVKTDGSVLEGKILSRDAKGLSLQLDIPKNQPPLQLAPDSVAQVIEIDARGAQTAQAAGIATPVKRPAPRWDVPKEPAAPPVTPATKDPTYYLIPLQGVVGETFLADALEKSLADAALRKPTVVVLDINSPGGLVNEVSLMMKVIRRSNKDLRIVALVDQDLSAAAITSLSVRQIFVKSSATIGAATAYDASDPDMPKDIQEKMQSAWRAVARNSAEEGGHDPLLAEAMIDSAMELHVETVNGKKVVKEGPGPNTLVTKGKILTLTSHEAVNCGLAVAIADDLAELGEELNLKGWKECPGLGTALAQFLPTRRDAFLEKAKDIENAMKDNIRIIQANAPSEEIITRRTITGGGMTGAPARGGPAIGPGGRGGGGMGGPRGGAGGMGGMGGGGYTGPRGGAGGMGGRGAPMGPGGMGTPQTVVTQQIRTVTPEQRAQWLHHSLITVAAIQRMEQNVQDEISLAEAFGYKGTAEKLKEPLADLADIRADVYADRLKYSGDSAPSNPAISVKPPTGQPPTAPATQPTGPTDPLQIIPGTAGAAPVLALKNAPLAASYSDLIKAAIAAKTYKVGPFHAGIFAKDEFRDITADGGILIGLRCGLRGSGKNAVVTSVQPVFLTPKGVSLGQQHGDPKASPVVDLIARDGYAIGGARLGGNINLEGLAIRFMRIKESGLDPSDAYETDYIGNFSPPTVVEAAMSLVGITGRTNTQGHLGLGFVFMPQPISAKNAPLAPAFSDLLKDAVAKKNFTTGKIISGGLAREAFEDASPDGGILIGLRCGMGKFVNTPVISYVQPIYLSAMGVSLGAIHGDPNASPIIDLVARDGYAVGGAKLAGSANLEGLQLFFVRLADDRLNPADAYDSDPLGNVDKATAIAPTTPVLGITGKTNNRTSIGLGFLTLKP
jgi:hypothetical protein